MRLLNSQQASFEQELTELLAFETVNDPALLATVDDIIAQVRQGGDEVVLRLTQQFDNHPAKTFAELEISQEKLKQAFDGLNPTIKQALELAAQRVTSFHERQRQESWTYQDALGNTLGQQVTPLDKVGIYVPGGLASYPSSVLMNAVPAHVAGVPEIIMVVPAPNGELNPLVLAAAYLAGVTRVFTIGGAQAVAGILHGQAPLGNPAELFGGRFSSNWACTAGNPITRLQSALKSARGWRRCWRPSQCGRTRSSNSR